MGFKAHQHKKVIYLADLGKGHVNPYIYSTHIVSYSTILSEKTVSFCSAKTSIFFIRKKWQCFYLKCL